VVSLGTSAPELFVSLNSVLQGSDALALSNVVGSNIFNVMVVLGSSALVLPLRVESRLVRRDVPLMIAVSAAVWGMASAGRVTWQAGLALLLGLIINTIWEIRTAREQPDDSESAEPEIEDNAAEGGWHLAVLRLIAGIAVLTVGSKVLVSGATSAATLLGVSEAVIGLTIVSAGTSMPELITSLVAALRGRTDLAIGNVVGSCLLNLMLVLGGTALVTGSQGLNVSPDLIHDDLPVMLLTSLACLPIFWTRGRISRLEGGLLLSLYVLYIVDNVLPRTNLSSWSDEFRLVMLCLVLPVVMITIITQAAVYWRTSR
jgi:cation:H+ antiporter